ncbi:PREDICTED: protein PFC0760c-like, partial [Vollenhovia emeryi]|uniref:protein PFC0760c-like n=1 Tax=Vollenhovia emeryi TaxID=411798 RepID=UPI0005F3DC7B
MIEEPEPIVSGIQTRSLEKSEGESVPFTRKELIEPLFYEHTFQAEIHNIPLNQQENINEPPENTNETETLPIIELNETENDTQNIQLETGTLLSENLNNNNNDNIANTSNSQIIIPPNLLQIINNLAGDYDYDEICQEKNSGTDFREVLTDETRGNNSNPEGDQDSLSYDEDSNEEDEEDNFEEEEDDDSDKDIDETYNELESDDLINETEKQMEIRGQKSSIINSRDQIFMRKENYLYLLTKDGKPCDEGSKQLQKRNLIPKIKEDQ